MSEPAYGSPSAGVPDPDLRARAMRNLHRKRAFRTHLVVYGVVNASLIATWLVIGLTSGAWFPWFVFPLFGWGIGVAIQAWHVYGGGEIGEEQIRQEMNRLNRP